MGLRRFSRTLFRALALCLWMSASGGLGANAFAGPEDVGVRAGFDAEISPRHFASLLKYFDFKHLENAVKRYVPEVLTESMLEDYLVNPQALESVPPAYRAKLTEGLNLASPTFGEPPKKEVKLFGADGKMIDASAPVRAPKPADPPVNLEGKSPQGLIVTGPDRKAPLFEHEKKIQEFEASQAKKANPYAGAAQQTSDWMLLQKRWANIPLKERASFVQFSLLSSTRQAEVISKLPIPGKDASSLARFLRLRLEAPVWLRELKISLDGTEGARPFEFAMSKPAEPGAAKEIARNLMTETGVTQQWMNPLKFPEGDTYLHWHASSERITKAQMEALLTAYKKLILVRMMDADPRFDRAARLLPDRRTAMDVNIFGLRLGDKGLVRMVNQDHAEVRELTRAVPEVLDEFVDFLKDPDGALPKIEAERREILNRNPEILKRIEVRNPQALLEFESDFPEGVALEKVETYLRRLVAEADIINSHFMINQLAAFSKQVPTPRTLDLVLKAAGDLKRSDILQIYVLKPILDHDPRAAQKIVSFANEHPGIVSANLISGLSIHLPPNQTSQLLTRMMEGLPHERNPILRLGNVYGLLHEILSPVYLDRKQRLETAEFLVKYAESSYADPLEILLLNETLKSVEPLRPTLGEGLLPRELAHDFILRTDRALLAKRVSPVELSKRALNSRLSPLREAGAAFAAAHGLLPKREGYTGAPAILDQLEMRNFPEMIQEFIREPELARDYSDLGKLVDLNQPAFVAAIEEALRDPKYSGYTAKKLQKLLEAVRGHGGGTDPATCLRNRTAAGL